MREKKDYPILSFSSATEWEKWLHKNHAESDGIWLRFFKKDSGVSSVKYAEALDGALAYGWIDGQLKKYDEKSWLHKFTPRRSKSMWSKRNTEHIARLIKAGKMQPAGLKQVAAAKNDGRWEKAYESPGKMAMPTDFLEKLSKNKKAQAFFDTLSKSNTYAIAWRLHSVKKVETREKRLKDILAMLAQGKKFY